MKIWTNNQFVGHWPVGTAAVCVADSAANAAYMLNDDLESRGLSRSARSEDFLPMAPDLPQCRILCDGDY